MDIEFFQFSFKYRALQNPTLKNINLTIKSGEKILIVGPSGSGKSTLGMCLNGLIPSVVEGDISGKLFIDGIDVQPQDLYQRARVVGTVLQDTDGQFVGLNVGEDIAFALENQRVEQCEMYSIVDKTAQLVDLASLLKHSPFEISGGQKQRVSLAGILVDDVDVLLFDEPLASLDPKTGELAIEIIDRLHRDMGKTVIIIEHRLEDVLHCPVDRIVLMDKGRIVADTTPDALLASSLLAVYGIREPLYLRALSLAGCEVNESDSPASFSDMELEPFKSSLLNWFQQRERTVNNASDEVLLDIQNLSYSYDGQTSTLDDISFSVKRGEFLSVLGKNGSGKSTLTKIIMGALDADQGVINFSGNDLAEMSIFLRSEKIGLVMQNPNHMISHHMIFDEIAFGLRNRGVDEHEVERRVAETLELCGLKPYARWPVDALSYGQKKRVTIASVLVLEPELLILDEPTAGQDYRHYTAMMQFIRELNTRQGISIVIISHDMHLVLEYTDRAVVLSDGLLLADSPVYSIFSQPELLEKANLTETSLYQMADRLNIESIDQFIRHFISDESRSRQ
jgi:energy-coupling factor transport system ATP-binding protein